MCSRDDAYKLLILITREAIFGSLNFIALRIYALTLIFVQFPAH